MEEQSTCTVKTWNGLNKMISTEKMNTLTALKRVTDYRKTALANGVKHPDNEILYQIIDYDDTDTITNISYYLNTYLSADELDRFVKVHPNARYGVIHNPGAKMLCNIIAEEEKSKRIMPITLREANAFVKTNHRHHDNVTGCKFAIGLVKTVKGQEKLIGVAICGRPVSRVLDDGMTLEINRLCTTESGNCCTMLYGAAARIAKDMGYLKVITYILESESGKSLKASGFTLENARCGGVEWTGSRKTKKEKVPPKELKQRWVKNVA